MVLRMALLGIAAVPLIAHAVDGPKRELVGITPWEQTEASREINERIMRDRVGPIACPKRERRAPWKNLLDREYAWCGEWIDERGRSAAVNAGAGR